MKIVDLFLSIEKHATGGFDTSKEHTDVIVQLIDGRKYIASFFTYGSIERLKLEHQQTGEYMAGKYFRVENMVLVENCSKDNVKEIVEELIDEGEFESVFKLITT